MTGKYQQTDEWSHSRKLFPTMIVTLINCKEKTKSRVILLSCDADSILSDASHSEKARDDG